MGYASSFADYDWFLNYVEKLELVSPEAVMEAARKYLDPQKRVIGYYLPQNGSNHG